MLKKNKKKEQEKAILQSHLDKITSAENQI